MTDLAENEIWLRVSRNGNSCGYVLFRNDNFRLGINVLPKFWKEEPSCLKTTINLDHLNRNEFDQNATIILYEMQFLRIISSDVELLDQVINSLIGIKVNDDSVESQTDLDDFENSESPLFSKTFKPRGDLKELNQEDLHNPDDFWNIVSNSDMPLTLADTNQIDYSFMSNRLNNIDERVLKELVKIRRRTFLSEAEKMVSRLKPVFAPRIESLSSVRGSIVLTNLFQRKATRSARIQCEFDELAIDSIWYQLIKAANLVALKQEIETQTDEWTNRSERIERNLRSIPQLRAREALMGISTERLPRKFKQYKDCCDLAIMMLRDENHLSSGSTTVNETGVAISIRVSTAKLFENLLNNRKFDRYTLCLINKEGAKHTINIREKSLKGNLFIGKEPDLAVIEDRKDSEKEIVGFFDAKYKSPNGGPTFSNMSLSDQYQQYTYAAASGKPTHFIYIATKEPSSQFFDTARILINTHAEIEIGIQSVTFPENGDLETWWSMQQISFGR